MTSISPLYLGKLTVGTQDLQIERGIINKHPRLITAQTVRGRCKIQSSTQDSLKISFSAESFMTICSQICLYIGSSEEEEERK